MEFIKNREYYFDRVIYRYYSCSDGAQMIINNLNNHTVTYLEDLSAMLFNILETSSYEEISLFLNENDISSMELVDFIDDLRESLTLNCFARGTSTENVESEESSSDSQVLDFHEKLFEEGYLFNFHMDITNECNIRCKHCYHPFEDYCINGCLSLGDIERIIDDIYDLGVFSITLSGGEPFMREDIYEVLKYISQKGMCIDLFTNATLLDDDSIGKLSEFNINKVSISLYSMEDKIHDGITQCKGSYRKTKEAIGKLKAKNINVELKAVLMKENFSGYKELLRFAKDNSYKMILDTSITPKLNSDLEPIGLSISEEQYRKLCLDKETNYYANNNKPLSPNEPSCKAGRYGLYCDSIGNVQPCISFKLDLGKVSEIKRIWTRSEVLKKWLNIRNKDYWEYGKFTYCEYCLEICAGIAQLENFDFKKCEKSDCYKSKIRERVHKILKGGDYSEKVEDKESC
ncbi:antilisterial bacteriocin subtilosin biosynthesis protein AlbA [Andreesenia angusta]|uniref:Antilisterial bacteriocin subtilosin biosynthesis protein AlbA n=2 Tax=Andreesenia angusta TaxID=39480 RepID=A0A1S1V6E9_9FIRM|nr:antilisterial bacteriocin subtilosin biosynthesis protein AlbA [Andreesenia angusta]